MFHAIGFSWSVIFFVKNWDRVCVDDEKVEMNISEPTFEFVNVLTLC